jgi:hypothetical protein
MGLFDSMFGGGGGDNANYIGGSDMGGYTGSGNNQNTYGPYGNMSRAEYRDQYGGHDNSQNNQNRNRNNNNPAKQDANPYVAPVYVPQEAYTPPPRAEYESLGAVPTENVNMSYQSSPGVVSKQALEKARGGQVHGNNVSDIATRLAKLIMEEMKSDPLFERKIQSILSKM